MANSSIIMVENIFRILQQRQGSIRNNTLLAAKEVGRHIFHASFIIILVFIPLFALEGIEGRMFAPTAFAVAASLFGGLVCALSLQPVLCTYFLKPGAIPQLDNRLIRSLKSGYRFLLDCCLGHRAAFLAATVAAFLAVLVLLAPHVGREFLPQMDEGALIASTVLPPGTSLQESDRIGRIVEQALFSVPEVLSVNRTTGRAEQSEHAHGVNHSHYIMELVPKANRDRSLDELLADMRERLDRIPGIHYIFEQPIQNKLAEMLTGIEGEIAIKLFGPDLDVLHEKIRAIRDVVSHVEGVADLQVEQAAGTPQVNIHLDRRKLARYGVNIQEVSDIIETSLNGVEATDILDGHRRYGVFLRFQEPYREHLEDIKALLVDTPAGPRVPLSELAHFEIGSGPLTIMREHVTRRRVIICNVHNRDQSSWVQEARERIHREVHLPEGYYVTFGGQFESYQRASRQLSAMIFIVAVIVFFLVYLSFRSLRDAVLILFNVPFAMMGGVVALWLTGITLNVSSAVGFIALFGISIQNAIILAAFIRNRLREGASLHDAVMDGALVRMRPILMTELVIIAGVLPLALFTGVSGSELQQPMAVVYIGGELTAIFITGLQLPVLYSLFGNGRKNREPVS
jgi:cobalt-zinc-cadmium resistance protein CzcA